MLFDMPLADPSACCTRPTFIWTGRLRRPAAAGHDRERGRRVFQRIVDRALADQVDLLLIAGDLFDHNRVPDGPSP